jgi:hypothetical protein
VAQGLHAAGESVINWPVSQEGEGDPVSIALATALERASAVGQWDVVLALAAELKARRLCT